MFPAFGTRTCSYEEITGWFAAAGMGTFGRIDLPAEGQTSLGTAVKQG